MPHDAGLLAARKLIAGYDRLAVVHDLDLHVGNGEVVALLGANGAGKSTTLLTLCGELPVIGGEVVWRGQATRDPLHRRARQGLAFLPEGRAVFMHLTVEENLLLGPGGVEKALDLFPVLRALRHRRVGLLSGGEQQILAVTRALAADPLVLIIDELSLGLAPKIVERLIEALRAGADRGTGVLFVEQHLRFALDAADRVYVMQRGRLQLAGTAAELRGRLLEIEASYFEGRHRA